MTTRQLAFAFLLSGILWALIGVAVYFTITHWPTDDTPPLPSCHGKCSIKTT